MNWVTYPTFMVFTATFMGMTILNFVKYRYHVKNLKCNTEFGTVLQLNVFGGAIITQCQVSTLITNI